MSNYGTKLVEMFSQKVIGIFFERSVSDSICNNEYEGEIKDRSSKLNIYTFGKLTLKDYTGADLTADDPQESIALLSTDQQKAYYFKIKSLDKFHSWIKNPEGTLIEQCGNSLKETIDAYVLALYPDVAAGQRIGTDYTTGTVAVAVTTGDVTGTGTTFTADMVGKGFKATGHTKWYRVKSYVSATAIVIEDDLDDATSAYTGGAIAAGASYVIEAATKLQVSKTTIYSKICDLKTLLDLAKIPATDRWLVVPSKIANLLIQASELIPAVPTAYENTVLKGLIGEVAGFRVFQSEQVNGDNTNGYHVLAGHKSAITLGLAFTESGIEDSIPGNFGQAYKGLNIYGAKVVDERRKALAELFCYV